MSVRNQRYPIMDTQKEIVRFSSYWTSPASAGDMVKRAGDGSTSLERNAATGKYILTLEAPFPKAELLGGLFIAHAVTGALPLIGNVLVDSYDSDTGEVEVEFYDADATNALADPVTAGHPKVSGYVEFIDATI